MKVICEVAALVGTGMQWEMEVLFPPRVGDLVQGSPDAPLEDFTVEAVVHRHIGNTQPVVLLRLRR